MKMNNTQPTKSTPKARSAKSEKRQDKRQKFEERVIAIALILQAIFIGVNGTRDVLSGKPTLDVIQGMIVQGIELIVKANRNRKSFDQSDRS